MLVIPFTGSLSLPYPVQVAEHVYCFVCGDRGVSQDDDMSLSPDYVRASAMTHALSQSDLCGLICVVLSWS